jgi:hypothetical protein
MQPQAAEHYWRDVNHVSTSYHEPAVSILLYKKSVGTVSKLSGPKTFQQFPWVIDIVSLTAPPPHFLISPTF